jgi:molybdopterin biosynthesis enzyme
VTFYLFVRKAILVMQSAANAGLASGFAVAEDDIKGTKERESYLPAVLGTDAQGRLIASPIRWHGSSDFIGFSAADALVIIPEGGRIAAGETAGVLFLP